MCCVPQPAQPQSRRSPLAGSLNCAFTKDYSAHTSLQSKELRRRLTKEQTKPCVEAGVGTQDSPTAWRRTVRYIIKTEDMGRRSVVVELFDGRDPWFSSSYSFNSSNTEFLFDNPMSITSHVNVNVAPHNVGALVRATRVW